MENRININELEPKAYQAMPGLQAYLNSTELDVVLKELVKIRASQLNGCAYCIQMHAKDVRKLGETEDRVYALSAWKESPLFTDTERVVFSNTEEITEISNDGLSKEIYEKAISLLGERDLAQWIMYVVTINAWNRIAVSTKMKHT